MTPESLEMLSAFVDGEPADTLALARALGEPNARDVLFDYLLVRAGVQHNVAPPEEFVAGLRSQLSGASPRRVMPFRTLLTAAAMIVALLTGLWIGRETTPSPDEPPHTERVLTFEPGVDWQIERQP